jgi:hypothetical protein
MPQPRQDTTTPVPGTTAPAQSAEADELAHELAARPVPSSGTTGRAHHG